MTLVLRPSLQKLVLEIYNNGYTNSEIQKVYGAKLSFYINIWLLRDNNIVVVDDTDNHNKKKWVLTEKGEKIAKLLIRLNKLLESDKNEV